MKETVAADAELRARQAELVVGVAHGDERALSELYDAFERPLYSLGMRWLHDPELAEELVQEVIVRVWKGAQTFDRARGEVSSWIFGIARNVATDLLRAQSRRPVPVEEVYAGGTAELDEDAAWRGWQVGRAVSALPDDQQRVVELAFAKGYTHAEISKALKVPIGTVKTRLYAGLKKLRRSLIELGVVEEGRA